MNRLPDRPNLDYLKKQAKDLIRLYRGSVIPYRRPPASLTTRSCRSSSVCTTRYPASRAVTVSRPGFFFGNTSRRTQRSARIMQAE